jgi:hypothetical protein
MPLTLKPFLILAITTSDWKAWINEMLVVIPSIYPFLHVTGTVDTGNQQLAFLRKRIPQGIVAEILILDLLTVTGIVPVKQPQPVLYHEEIPNMPHYSTIQIYIGKHLEAEIKNIPIVR